MERDAASYLRIFASEDGESHFDEPSVGLSPSDFAPPAPPFFLSERVAASQMIFCRFPRGWHGDWHPTPARQFFLMIGGLLEVEVSDGERRQLAPGNVVLVEDRTGKGHVTRVVGLKDVTGVLVQVP